MTWLSFDDGYTRERVWDDVPHDSRWHFHAVVELCCATRRYDGRLRWPDALRCSDVPDPQRSMKELIEAGLLVDHGAEVEVESIDVFLPPEGERAENLLVRKRRNQAAYRKRQCERGQHSKDCPAKSCPVKLASAASVADSVTGNAGTGRGGPGRSPKNEVQGLTAAGEKASVTLLATDKEAPSQSRKSTEITTARADVVPDAQHLPVDVHRQSQSADRNAREGEPESAANGHGQRISDDQAAADRAELSLLSGERQAELLDAAVGQLGSEATNRELLHAAAALAGAGVP